jgi:CubicO group peptidase (beta-lactamase class C family)
VEELLDVRGLPGLSLAVTDRDGLVTSASSGYADLAACTPVAPEIGLGARLHRQDVHRGLLLQLHDEGRLDLQTPVVR